MIDDPYPWKLELLRLSHQLEADYADNDLFPGSDLDAETQQIFVVERFAFVTALVLRKLAEAGKVSVQFLSTSIQYERHPIRDQSRAPDQLNMHRASEFYDEPGIRGRMSYVGFANMLIHSKAFVTIEDRNGSGRPIPYGFAVTSDRTHSTYLSFFPSHELKELVKRLMDDEIVQKVVIRDGQGGYLSVGSREPMDPKGLRDYLDRSPHKDIAAEIRRFMADRLA